MTLSELDRLVERIGDEILARVGLADAGPRAAAAQPAAVVAAQVTRFDAAVASLIDHTLLRPDATREEIVRLCREARQYGFASVCVNPCWVPVAAAELAGGAIKVCSVAGFPLGASLTEIKAAEAAASIRAGAREIDMVINVGALRSGDYERVHQDIGGVAKVCHDGGALLKTILETGLLDDAQKASACAIAKMAGADFVKTATGFASGGATEHDVALMRRVVGPDTGVKAAGGIRTLEDLRKMTAAGASRIGASASVKIMQATAG
jgi:deoxyribose-phosphate aldolase